MIFSSLKISPKNANAARRSFQTGSKKAFTLPEVIVAMSVLIMVVIASTNLLVSIIRNNTENINTLVAYTLAQEGLEGVRNIRDSDWLLGADFTGKIEHHEIWGASLPQGSDAQFYTFDHHPVDAGLCSLQLDMSAIAGCVPWKLALLNPPLGSDHPDVQTTLIYQKTDNDLVRYVHEVSDTPTPFHRYLKIVPLPYAEKTTTLKYRVTAVVYWQEGARSKEVRLTTEITNWKGGAL